MMQIIKIVVVEPGKKPYVTMVDYEGDAFSDIVGGMLEFVYPFDDDAIICLNETGKLEGLPLNRTLSVENGKPVDIIAGTFLICGIDEGHCASLTEEQTSKYTKLYEKPETFPYSTEEYVMEQSKDILRWGVFPLRL